MEDRRQTDPGIHFLSNPIETKRPSGMYLPDGLLRRNLDYISQRFEKENGLPNRNEYTIPEGLTNEKIKNL